MGLEWTDVITIAIVTIAITSIVISLAYFDWKGGSK